MTNNPYWIAFGDIHDDFGRIGEIPELSGALGVIITGDITFAGGSQKAATVLDAIRAKNPVILAQIGNMDKPEVTVWLEEKGINLHCRTKELFPGVTAMGVGGSNPSPFDTPSEFTEEEIAAFLEETAKKTVTGNRLVLIAHSPPFSTSCDRLTNGMSVGSTAVRDFIEKHQPDCCICGHIHESRATDTIGATTIINPGPLAVGGYVLLSRPDPKGPVRAELKTLR